MWPGPRIASGIGHGPHAGPIGLVRGDGDAGLAAQKLSGVDRWWTVAE